MKNIIITGGELFNKGAQAMTFITVDECRKRFPDHEIYLLSEMDRRRPEQEKNAFTFKFCGWYPVKFARARKNPLLKAGYMLRNGAEFRECDELYKNCDLMLDISGYALGSGWTKGTLNNYIDHLEFAEAYNIPMYIMPQSLGPFDMPEDIDSRLKKLLPGVKMICAREQEGYDAVKAKYALDNICIKPDIVLNNKGIDTGNIYKHLPELYIPEIAPGSVAIIPNTRLLKVVDKAELLDTYAQIIAKLISEDHNVYIFVHSTNDIQLAKEIKSGFEDCGKVTVLEHEFSCLEYSELVKSFEFIIASRFHSIVHAFKEGIPSVSIGWAEKYSNLHSQFGQEQYVFDARTGLPVSGILTSIENLEKNRAVESGKIKASLCKIREDNVFDIIAL